MPKKDETPNVYLVKIKMKDGGKVVEVGPSTAAAMVDGGYATTVETTTEAR